MNGMKEWWKSVVTCICTCGGRRRHRIHPQDARRVVVPGRNKVEEVKDLKEQSETCCPDPRANVNEIEDVVDGVKSCVNENAGFIPDSLKSSESHEGKEASSDAESEKNNKIGERIAKEDFFLDVGNGKLLRVIHIKPILDSEWTNSRETMGAESIVAAEEVKEEEEETYWFSKWSRKPRFRSIFQKHTIVQNGGNQRVESGQFNDALEMKRRKWAYENEGKLCYSSSKSGTVIVDERPVPDQEEYNSMDVCNINSHAGNKTCHPLNCSSNVNEGVDNLAFEGDTTIYEEGCQALEMEEIERGVEVGGCVGSRDDAKAIKNDGIFTKDIEGSGENVEDVMEPGSSSSFIKNLNTNAHNLVIKKENENIDDESNLPLNCNGTTGPMNRKQPILFFIHTLASSSDVWSSQIQHFIKFGFEVIAPDLLGHGLSSAPSSGKHYYFESLVQDLLVVYDHFVQPDDKCILIGHGYGAPMAALLSRVRCKQTVIQVLISGGGPTPMVGPSCCRHSLFPMYCKFLHSSKKSNARFGNPELEKVLPKRIYDHMIAGQLWLDGDSSFYRRIITPTLLVYGMRDKVVNLVEECEMERTIGKSFLELIESAGHMIMWDEPDRLNKMMHKFIQQWL